jgi:hypothetical protein
LDALSDRDLQELASSQMAESELERYDKLLELNADGSISVSERQELWALRKESERFMLRKTQASILLRWRRIPAVER